MGKHSYAIVLDAGSSGTRVYVYRWRKNAYARKKYDDEKLDSLPRIKTNKKWRKKVHPGISTFGDKPEAVGSEHLKELVEFAQDIVPKKEYENTPIFLLATAGMRLLPDSQRADLLSSTCSYFQRNTKFQLPDCGLHVQVIQGETEGLYGWIAANYLLGGFDSGAADDHDHGKNHHTYGFLDMGGASAQIAFAPNATEAEKHADDLKLLRLRKVNGEAAEYRVFVTTWLGFGANEARRRYVEHLLDVSPSAHELPDPCLPVGITIKKTGEVLEAGSGDLKGKEPYLLGTGDFTQCLKSTYPLLEKEKECTDAPCLLNGQHTPAIDFNVNHFVGVSEYWHTTHEVFAMAHKDKAYDFQTYQKQVTDFCSRDWKDIEKDVAKHTWGKKVDEKTVEEVCFKASWLINMLHEGIGIPRVGIEDGKPSSGENKTKAILDGAKDRGFLDPFQAVDKIDDKEVSWTLGKVVLYASSQVPPADGAMAVGFGSNVQGTKLPGDFQYPGGRIEGLPKLNETSPHEDDLDWHDKILSSSYSRRVPGILIFLVMLVLAVYLLCGRERRQSWYHKMLGKKGQPGSKRRKPPGRLGGKIFGSSSPSYDRVLEEGDPEEFELGDVSDEDRRSDSSNDGLDAMRSGRTSGMVTPALRGLSPDVSRNSPRAKNYFDSDTPPGTSNGLGITPFDRAGLLSRTESKERLHMPRSHSRRASPTRKSPLTPTLKET
ncbi:Golgi apyrase [Fulvia fulva]|uniref:Golgi apyrase n=1 Tax=Passalora fulva TaxID=5499 RepID=A0A9Q8PDM6_PASFU|nr:Golgi apyrase [Fulvia fulva]KAK4618324.1 Golgi apyrase [Fulvia fulva]KAK4618826.1 Golgi apyrase [Fulvia fulva]UJO20510.1 Golgi apyrase [Fulvia fulva]WPV18265.1 Golgi apyrase [Fulvia fulva]WPV33324.1 Golgi apyrase [Fulvia fulva]